MRTLSLLTLTAASSLALFAPGGDRPGPKPTVPLFDGLGKHTRPVATSSPVAQKYFDQGLAFMFAFNHDEAVRAFRQAAALDPECAMAYWGAALASGVNYNNPSFPPDKAKAAHDDIRTARRKAAQESPANRALIDALTARYADPQPADPRTLEAAYSKAMAAAWERFPDDADVGALYAESMMNLRPWELWTADGKPAPETPTILAVLEAVMKLDPDHPLALHLYIHAVEASPTPEKADGAADRLRGAQPALGHLLHMPSHIDLRRGRWREAVEANQLAVAADTKYQATVPEQGFYRMYMAHNYHMLAFAAAMQGESKRALAAAREMVAGMPPAWLAVKENAAIADGFVAVPVEVLKRFGRWDDVLAEPEPAAAYPVARAMQHAARGVAFAVKGRPADARREQAAFRAAAKAVPADARVGNNSAAGLLAVAADVLEGETLAREGKVADGIAALRSAAAKEDRLRYSEPPDWFIPVRHALGGFLLRSGQAAAAERVYRDDLRRWPDNGWALHGLAASLDAQGQHAAAAAVRERFRRVWERADVEIPWSCFCVPD